MIYPEIAKAKLVFIYKGILLISILLSLTENWQKRFLQVWKNLRSYPTLYAGFFAVRLRQKISESYCQKIRREKVQVIRKKLHLRKKLSQPVISPFLFNNILFKNYTLTRSFYIFFAKV